MNNLFWNTTIHCHRLKNAGFDVKNDVISGVLFHLKSAVPSERRDDDVGWRPRFVKTTVRDSKRVPHDAINNDERGVW